MKATDRTTYPKGTTAAQWLAFNIEQKEFLERMEAKRPNAKMFDNPEDYRRAYNEWQRSLFMDAPNEPGYYRANND